MPEDDIPQFLPPPPRERPLRAERVEAEPLPSAPPPPPPSPTVVKRGLFDYVGPRAERRPEPRLGVGLAGTGAVMLVVGVLAISGDQLAGERGNDGSQFPGVLISLAVIVAGVVLIARYRHGPLPAAGVAASALALPPFVFFLTFSKSSPPSFNTILLLSCAGWAAGYIAGPGRGHPFYLGAGLIGLWLWFVELTENVFSFPIDSIFLFASGAAFSSDSSSSEPVRSVPDATNIGVYSVLFGIGYLVAGRVLDRRERRGMATPFMFAGLVTLVLGIALISNDLEQVGTGVTATIAGVILAFLGATEGRRATNWVGAALVFIGLTIIVGDVFDTPTSFGVAELLVGGGVIVGAHWLATTFLEPPEDMHVLSRFYNSGSVQPSGPPPPPAGSVLG